MKNSIKKIIFSVFFITSLSFGFSIFGEEVATCPQNQELIDSICVDKEEIIEEEIIEEKLNITASLDVPQSCSVIDLDGQTHFYDGSIDGTYLGVCALYSLLENGEVPSVGLSNAYPSMGLFVTSFGDIEADPNSEYWSLYKNNGFAESGITTMAVSVGDTISFKLSNFDGLETGDLVEMTINSLIVNDATESDEGEEDNIINCLSNEELKDGICIEKVVEEDNTGGGYSSGSSHKDDFSLEEALDFLISNQSEDGSFGDDMYTDWAIIGLSKLDINNDIILEKLKDFILSDDMDQGEVTDYARRAMALMSLGINPYNDTDVNYIENIIREFDGEQIGDKDLVNDDIFSLIVLAHAGYTKDDEVIKNIISFIISKQGSDGSFGSVDMTSAFIMSLSNFGDLDDVENSLIKGKDYVLGEMEGDGSFGNIYSTSWATQALLENDSYEGEVNLALDFMKDSQKDDGSMLDGSIENKIWATVYALPVINELSWNDILEDFDKEEIENEAIDGKDESKNENLGVVLSENIETKTEQTELKINQELGLSKKENVEKKETIILQNNFMKEIVVEVEEDMNNLSASALLAMTDEQEENFWKQIIDTLKSLWVYILQVFI